MTFDDDIRDRILKASANEKLQRAGRSFFEASIEAKYSYHFKWLGRPIIQYPQDVMAMQELIWQIKPDLIIETGIAHGGSLILYASLLELNAACGGPEDAEVVGIDIDIREHNRDAVEEHPLSKRITLLSGSSIDPQVVNEARLLAQTKQCVMVCLDSNHTHDHVLRELEIYAPLVASGSYCVVFDTCIEILPASTSKDRPWGPGNSPKTAVHEFLKTHPEFEIDRDVENKLLITVAPDGYLKRIY